MRVSVQNSRVVAYYGLDEGFKLLHDAGFQGVDFNLNNWFSAAAIRADEPVPMDQPLEALYDIFRPYKEAAERQHMVVSQTHSPFPSWLPEKDALNARVLEGQKKTIALTGYLGSRYCVIHPAFHPDSTKRLSAKEEWELNRDMYSALIPVLREHHVVACLENMFTGGTEGMRYAAVCSDFHQAAEWIDRLNDIAGEELFGFCFDAGHCTLTGQNMRYSLNVIGKRLKVLHINDNDGHTDWHVAPYMGVGNWEAFIDGLRDIGYDGDLSFETFNVLNRYPEPMWRTALQLIAETGAYFGKRIQEKT